MKYIDKSTRLTNYLIDFFAILLLNVLYLLFFNSHVNPKLVLSILTILYYFCFELSSGQTLGKMVTGTIVTNKQGKKPGVFKIFLRSLLRVVPLDVLSYLFGFELGLHDIVSSTQLKRKEQ